MPLRYGEPSVLVTTCLRDPFRAPTARTSEGVTASGGQVSFDVYALLPVTPVRRLDAGILDAAWRLGAWDLARTEHPPLPADEDPFAPGHGLVTAFAGNPYEVGGLPMDLGTPLRT